MSNRFEDLFNDNKEPISITNVDIERVISRTMMKMPEGAPTARLIEKMSMDIMYYLAEKRLISLAPQKPSNDGGMLQ